MIALPFIKSPDIFETILNFVGKVPWIMLHGEITRRLNFFRISSFLFSKLKYSPRCEWLKS